MVSSLTFIASVNAIRYVGAQPIMVDSEPDNWQINSKLIENFLKNKCYMVKNKCIYIETGQKVAAILPVHILGHSCDIKAIQRIAKEYKLMIIEDAAEGLGVKFHGNCLISIKTKTTYRSKSTNLFTMKFNT